MHKTYLVIMWLTTVLAINCGVPQPGIFDTLTKLEAYAASTEENPNTKILDWENPDFSLFFIQHEPSLLKKIAYMLGLSRPLWDPYSFIKLLKMVTTDREYRGLMAPFLYKIEPAPGSTFIIFGELFGAFHSLVRDLRSLQYNGYIDENLKITNPDCFIVFNGNIASRSAYALETLTVILRLLYVNNNSVIVILGGQEESSHWKHYAIKRELKVKVPKLKNSRFSSETQINRFFETLPSALYLVAKRTSKEVEVVRISNAGLENKQISEKLTGDFFKTPEQKIFKIVTEEKQRSSIEVNVKAIVRGEPFFRSVYIPTQGLQSSGKEEGAVSWALMSSPLRSSQELFQFYYDAYVILSTAKSLDDWTITLYNSDVREFEKIKPSKTVKFLTRQELNPLETIQAQIKITQDRKNFLSTEVSNISKKIALTQAGGILDSHQLETTTQETEQVFEPEGTPIEASELPTQIPLGKKKSTISIASIVDHSKFTKIEGESIETGIRLVANYANKHDSLPGTTLNLISCDSQFNKDKARECVLKALKDENTGLILVPFGTESLEGFIDLIEKKSILVLFPAASGAGRLRSPGLSNIFFMRASGMQETYVLTKYMLKELNGKKFAFFYPNNTFGQESLQGALQALKEANKSDYIAVSYEQNNLNFTEQVHHIQQFNGDSLGIFAIQADAKELLGQLDTEWLADKKLFGSQDLSSQSFRKYIDHNKLKFICTSVVPNPAGPLLTAQHYRFITKNIPIANDTYCFEAYIAADFFTHILQNISQPITGEKIIDFLENLKDYSFKGLTLDFDPNNRSLLHSVWLASSEKDWKEIKLAHSDTPTPANKQDKKSLNVGSVLDLSRADAVIGTKIKKVMEYIIEQANTHKDKDIPFIDLKILDSEYSPEKARKAIETLMTTYHTDIILCPVGSQPFMNYIDLVKKGDIVTLFPVPGIPGKRFAIPHAIFLRASYYDEAQVLTHYLIENFKPQTVAVVYQNDAFGTSMLNGTKEELEKANIKYTALPYERNSANFSDQIELIKKMNPDTIGLFSGPEATMAFLRQLGEPFITRKQFFGSSDLGAIVVQNFIKKNNIKCIISNIVPNPQDQTLALSNEFQKDMKNAHIIADTISFEVYISTHIFLHLIKQIKEPINKQSIMHAGEQLKHFNYKGLLLDFDPKTRQLLHTVWVNPGTGASWIPISLTTIGNSNPSQEQTAFERVQKKLVVARDRSRQSIT